MSKFCFIDTLSINNLIINLIINNKCDNKDSGPNIFTPYMPLKLRIGVYHNLILSHWNKSYESQL